MTTVLARKVTIVKRLAADGQKKKRRKKVEVGRAETRLCSMYFTGLEEKWK